MIMGLIVSRSDRHKKIDLTEEYTYETFTLLIPVSDEIGTNADAVIKPFQWPVSWHHLKNVRKSNLKCLPFS